jgi:hypothetical protein
MSVRRNTIKREVGPALYSVMEPGDQIVAGTWAAAGIGPWLDVVAAMLVVAFALVGVKLGDGPTWATFGVILLPLLRVGTRRPVFVAVTQRQLICYRLSRVTNSPGRLLFCAALPAVRVTSLRRTVPGWRSIRYDGPGAGERGLRLNVPGSWRQDLDEVLPALNALGASVSGLPAVQAAPQFPAAEPHGR